MWTPLTKYLESLMAPLQYYITLYLINYNLKYLVCDVFYSVYIVEKNILDDPVRNARHKILFRQN